MGSGMGKYLLEKEGVEIVGVICSTERENGMYLGVLLVTKINGIICSNNANAVLKIPTDIILIRPPDVRGGHYRNWHFHHPWFSANSRSLL